MLAVIRIRGTVGVSRRNRSTLESLGFRKTNNMIIVDEKMKNAIEKINSYVTWGEIDSDLLARFKDQKTARMSPPKGGYKAIRKFYPKGDLGYRGTAINELIRKMI